MTPAGQLAAAIDLLAEVEADPRPADAVANGFFRNRRFIGGGDRREVSGLVWGAIRARRRLGWWLRRVAGAETPRLLVAAHAVLGGMAVAKVERAFVGNYGPPPLRVDELAVLERLAAHTLEHPAMPEAVRLEVPDWIYPRFQAQFGGAVEAELQAMAVPAPLDLRANALKATREAALAALAAEGMRAVPTRFSPWGLRLDGRQSVTGTRAFKGGLVEIQDEGSQLVALLVDAAPGMRVADYCAGAGGKTLAVAATMDNRGHVVACDTSEPRLEGAVKRLRRAGVHNAERHLLAPGDRWVKRQAGKFDRVLVDAPCTGTGTWRRNPDAPLRLSERDLEELIAKQATILDTASNLVKPGGRLIYATCSLLNDENEAQAEAFLIRHPMFRQVPLPEGFAGGLRGPALRLTPRVHGTDGFFGVVLERPA